MTLEAARKRPGRKPGSIARKYTREQVADALAALMANEGDVKGTARDLGISRTTLRGWAGKNVHQNGRPKTVTPSEVLTTAESMANTYELLSLKALRRLDETLDQVEGRTASDAQRLALIAAITTDKMQLLRQKPTNITADAVDLASFLASSGYERVRLRVLPAASEPALGEPARPVEERPTGS